MGQHPINYVPKVVSYFIILVLCQSLGFDFQIHFQKFS